MRRINKQAEPRCMGPLRQRVQPTVSADWSKKSQAETNEMRTALLAEQGGLCAYCMTPLKDVGYDAVAFASGTKIEHHEPRSVQPGRMFDWENLLAVCGGEQPERHCDGSRAPNTTLAVRPARQRPDPDAIFEYPANRRDGGRDVAVVAGASAADATAGNEAIAALRLNDIAHLRENRDDAIEKVQDILHKDDSAATLLRLYAEATRRRPLPPYAGAVAWYLRKKLRAARVPIRA